MRIKNVIINLLLFIISIILFIILLPISFFYSIIKNIIFLRFKKLIIGTAIKIDKIGNTMCEELFNDTLIKYTYIRFGDSRETVSSVLGKVVKQGYKTHNIWFLSFKEVYKATLVGNILINILDTIEKDHCIKSVIVI